MAIYTFHDLTHNIERQSTIHAVRALFILARHDIETKLLYEPISIELTHNGAYGVRRLLASALAS